jgi:small subunit ribosomal protein S1
VQVLELDASNRRLALSHKHMEENPWDTFENIFTIGSVHKCTVINKNDKGAMLELPYGIEGFCAAKNLQKEDNSKIEVGESLDFKVLEFSKDDRRIVLSHKAIWSADDDRQAAAAAAAAKKKPVQTKGSSIQSINQQNEKSTLGDLEALSALKEKMSGGGTEPKAE